MSNPAGRRRPRVLFVCTHNAGRSALGSALARHRACDAIEVDSAGTDPEPEPSADTIATLAELDIDASAHRPSAVTPARIAAADVLVAMKPGLKLPHVNGVRYKTWNLPDPAGWDAEGIRPLRDEIDRRVQVLLAELAADRRARAHRTPPRRPRKDRHDRQAHRPVRLHPQLRPLGGRAGAYPPLRRRRR